MHYAVHCLSYCSWKLFKNNNNKKLITSGIGVSHVPLSISYEFTLQFRLTQGSLLKDYFEGRLKVFHLAFEE